jgi:signal transduction histidine kinase
LERIKISPPKRAYKVTTLMTIWNAPESTTMSMYRIIAELITNSIKHAKCKNISIHFAQYTNGYTLDYIDDGIGFDNFTKRNHGINNVESRVRFLNGAIDFFSISGKTHYCIHIPHQKHEE